MTTTATATEGRGSGRAVKLARRLLAELEAAPELGREVSELRVRADECMTIAEWLENYGGSPKDAAKALRKDATSMRIRASKISGRAP